MNNFDTIAKVLLGTAFDSLNTFCSTCMPLASTDGFDQHFQATVHSPLSNSVD